MCKKESLLKFDGSKRWLGIFFGMEILPNRLLPELNFVNLESMKWIQKGFQTNRLIQQVRSVDGGFLILSLIGSYPNALLRWQGYR